MAYFSLSGPNIPSYVENLMKDPVPVAIIILYYGETRQKLCLTVDIKLTTMCPGEGMMANFSISGTNILLYIENMGRDPVPLAIIIFYYGERRENCVLTPNLLT